MLVESKDNATVGQRVVQKAELITDWMELKTVDSLVDMFVDKKVVAKVD